MSANRAAGVFATVVVGLVACAPAAVPSGSVSPVAGPAHAVLKPLDGPLRTEGSRLVSAEGRSVILRGAQIQGYNFVSTYRTTTWLNPGAFAAMRSWRMNELRLPFSGCLKSFA